LLRAKDSRAGFEAAPEMLSITGMTLEQFADLMAGLGYRGEKGERAKVKPAAEGAAVAEAGAEAASVEAPVDALSEPPVIALSETVEAVAPAEAAAEAETPVEVETETFYVFTWAPRARGGDGRGPRGRGGNDRRRGEAPAAEAGQAARPERPRGERRRDGERRDGERTEGGARPPREAGEGKPAHKGGKPGGKPNHKGGKPQGERGGERGGDRPRSFEARPHREAKIDPDNPFAVLAALKTRS
jgi:ATP-dependent RNA helicase SUPV3L1/SUV3